MCDNRFDFMGGKILQSLVNIHTTTVNAMQMYNVGAFSLYYFFSLLNAKGFPLYVLRPKRTKRRTSANSQR